MTLFSYEIFDAVARQGSFNKAAQQLHLTPSAISHAIAVMEAELGFTLFNRGKNGVTMTSYGASLYPSIRAVLNSDEALQQSIARLNGLEKGKVKLGAFNSVCAGLLPQKYIDYYSISYSYLHTVIERVRQRFPAEDCDKMEQMLSVISTELMPELDMLAKCHHSEAPAAPETPAEK